MTGKYLFYHVAAMKKLDDHIFDVITKLWSNKRKSNENSVLAVFDCLLKLQQEHMIFYICSKNNIIVIITIMITSCRQNTILCPFMF